MIPPSTSTRPPGSAGIVVSREATRAMNMICARLREMCNGSAWTTRKRRVDSAIQTRTVRPSRSGSRPAKALGQKTRQPTLAVADHEQAGDQTGGDQQPHDEGRDEALRNLGAEADQTADHQQAHQYQEVQRALAEDRAQAL